MVGPQVKREVALYLTDTHHFSKCRACGLVGLARSVYYHRSKRKDDSALRNRLKELAEKRPRFGYRRLQILLSREGFRANHKRIFRIYQEEGLAVRRKRRKKLVSGLRVKPNPPQRPNEHWSMDFTRDTLWYGQAFRTLNVVDEYTRECLAIEADTSLPGVRVVRVLERLAEMRGLPEIITVDNGPEFIGKVLDAWAAERNVKLDFIRPGKPVDNAYIESFNGKFRDECLNENVFANLFEARHRIELWRLDYNRVRPHSALGGKTPEEFAASCIWEERPVA